MLNRSGTTRAAVSTLLAFGLATALTACGTGSGGNNGGDNAEPADSGSVTWWGWTPDTPVAEAYIAAFNQDYPDIEVTYKNYENVDYRNALTPALDSGEGPDVYNLAPAGGSPDTWGAYALDMAPFAEETLGDGWQGKFGEGYLDQLSNSEGTLVALPLGGMTAGFLWYNNDIFEQAGATVPTDYATWQDACQKIQAIGKVCFTMGAGGQDTFPTELFHAIANSVDPDWFGEAAVGDAEWSDPQGVEVLEIIKRMQSDGIISANALDGPQYPLANEEFMKGEAAMVQMGYWYAQYSGLESATVAMESAGVSNPEPFVQLPMEFPDVAGQGNGSQVFGECDYGLAINADSKNVAAAKTFVRWMTMTEAGQQKVANAIDLIPGLKGVEPDWSAIALVDQARQEEAINDLLATSSAATQTRQWQTTEPTLLAMVVAIQEVLDPTINKDIESILETFQASSVASDVGR
ncbi:MAG: ABC transporter substrate-binding protein [Bifidobacteriaceae bacterium]|jgi:ABC-type glycerol-3-phosphate transport system substrate-binding protein|nr:ABC transporter substrate-binding protein [Bifidobacteriaceae bacterium]